MYKTNEISSVDLTDHLNAICNYLGIDTQKYTPVRMTDENEENPFINIYCINKLKSTPEKEWIEKFEVLTVSRLDPIFGDFPLDVAIEEKYLSNAYNEGNTIDFPDEED